MFSSANFPPPPPCSSQGAPCVNFPRSTAHVIEGRLEMQRAKDVYSSFRASPSKTANNGNPGWMLSDNHGGEVPSTNDHTASPTDQSSKHRPFPLLPPAGHSVGYLDKFITAPYTYACYPKAQKNQYPGYVIQRKSKMAC